MESFKQGTWFNGSLPAVDTYMARRAQPQRASGHAQGCPICGRRHFTDELCSEDGGVPLGNRSHNGEYTGDCPVRFLPMGVTGADLMRAAQNSLTKPAEVRFGQLWESSAARSVYTVRGIRHGVATLNGYYPCAVPVRTLIVSRTWRFVGEAA